MGRIQWAGSRARLAGWRRGRAAGCGEPESRARAERGKGWCPYIKAGPATLQGEGGETGRGRRGESSSGTASLVISTRWFCPPGTGEISGRGRGRRGRGVLSGSAITAAGAPAPPLFPIWSWGLFRRLFLLLVSKLRLRLFKAGQPEGLT